MVGWGQKQRQPEPFRPLAKRYPRSLFWGALGLCGLLHGSFVFMMWQAQSHWLMRAFPAAIVITLMHTVVGAIGSVWLAKASPRVLNIKANGLRPSPLDASFALTLITSGWLGYQTFSLIPTAEFVTSLNLGPIGLVLFVPLGIYFWRLGKSMSW